jgi:tetratricopeptide (TPR) repeat protein
MANCAEWSPDEAPENWFEEAYSSLKKAMELDPNDPEAHRIMGAVKLLVEGDMETAIFHHEKAIEICPSDTFHIARYAILLCYLGEPERGLTEIDRAMRIDPFCSDLIFETQGLCFSLIKKHDDALSSFKKMQIETRTSNFYQALCYKELDDSDKAKNYLELALSESNMSIEKFVSSQYFQDEQTSKYLNKCLASI